MKPTAILVYKRADEKIDTTTAATVSVRVFAFGRVTYLPFRSPFLDRSWRRWVPGYLTVLQMVNNSSFGTTGHLALFRQRHGAAGALTDGVRSPRWISHRSDASDSIDAERRHHRRLDANYVFAFRRTHTVILQFRRRDALRSRVNPRSIRSSNGFRRRNRATLNTGLRCESAR